MTLIRSSQRTKSPKLRKKSALLEFKLREKAVFTKMLIKQKPVRFQIDSGASTNILPSKHVEGVELSPCSQSLVMWNSTKVKPVGMCAASS